MWWRLILKYYRPNIHHKAGIDNIIADTLSRLPPENIDQDESSTMNDSHQANDIFAFNNYEYYKVNSPLAIPLVQMGQQKELNQRNSKLNVYITKE